jgi:hypothetical protein
VGRAGIPRERSARDDAVDVHVLGEGLAPGVEDGGDAEDSAEMARVAAEAQEGGDGGVEQETVEQLGVALGEGIEGVGSVKTTWKYGMDRTSRRRAASQRSVATHWHLGQWRLRHEL